MSKIAIYTIAKNEEQFVDRFMDNVGKADAVVVLDTGSTDNTVKKLKDRGAIVEQEVFNPWRFDKPRNRAMELCPTDCDILFSVDLDEVIAEKDWKERILSSWLGNNPRFNRGRYQYVWNHLPDGKPGRKFTYEKIHTREYEWYLPCHEVLRRKTNGEDHWCNIDITVEHFPDGTKSRGDYLPLLQIAVEENPNNDRIAHYYGRELFFHSRWQDAISQLERHVNLPTARWADEKAASMSYIAQCYDGLKRDDLAEKWHLRACSEAPYLREPFIQAAKFYNSRNRFPMGYALAKRAMEIEQKTGSYIEQEYAWNEGPYDLTSTAAYYLGLKPESLSLARKAVKIAPWDDRLKLNLEIIERMSPEITKEIPMPQVVRHEAWAHNPKFGLVISTYGAIPYVHLALEARRQLYPEVPAIVVDDCSKDQNRLKLLAEQYGVDFYCNAENLNHTRGDTVALVTGLRWANKKALDIIVKMSRRFIPRMDWRPSLHSLINQTMHATYAGRADPTWGVRTECIALHVQKWLGKAKELETTARSAQWLWVEKIVQDFATQIMGWGTGGQNGVATWDFPGLGKWAYLETALWHDSNSPKEYASFAQKLGLAYQAEDFKV